MSTTGVVVSVLDQLVKHCETKVAEAETLRSAAASQETRSFQFGQAEAYRDMIAYLKGE